MNRLLLLLLSMVFLADFAQAATTSSAKFGDQWRPLIGEWIGESATGARAGSCAFRFDLGDHIIVRNNHAEVPAKDNGPVAAHDDLMVIYPGATESQARAIYWDNEGHVIEYSATWSADGSTLTFLSKPDPGPQFRLTYKKMDSEGFTVSFDMSPPGQAGAFKTYTSGRLRRQK
jgi:hypothetical protein